MGPTSGVAAELRRRSDSAETLTADADAIVVVDVPFRLLLLREVVRRDVDDVDRSVSGNDDALLGGKEEEAVSSNERGAVEEEAVAKVDRRPEEPPADAAANDALALTAVPLSLDFLATVDAVDSERSRRKC